MAEIIIANHSPQDGRQWSGYCERCGAPIKWVHCESCNYDGSGCDHCDGSAGWWACSQPEKWCEANPLPDREDIKREYIEWFVAEKASP